MRFLNATSKIVYISEVKLIIPPKATFNIKKHLGFKYGLVPAKLKLRKKYENLINKD